MDNNDPNCQIAVNLKIFEIPFVGYFEKINDTYKIGAHAENLPPLSELLKIIFKKEINLPAIPDIKFNKLKLSYTKVDTKEKFAFSADMSGTWAIPLFNNDKIKMEFSDINFECSFSKKNNLESDIKINITTEGNFHIPNVLDINKFTFNFSYDNLKWNMKTNVDLTIFNYREKIEITYYETEKFQNFSFIIYESITPINIPNVFSLNIKNFSILITKEKNKKNNLFNGMNIELASSASLNLMPIKKELGGRLAISDSHMKFSSDDFIDFTIIKNESLDLGLSFKLKELKIAWGKDENLLNTSINMLIKKTGLPEFLKKSIPGNIDIDFSIIKDNSDNVSIKITGKNNDDPLKVELPDIEISDGSGEHITIDIKKYLSPLWIKLVELSISIGKKIESTIVIGVGFPENINDIFGTDIKNGKKESRLKLFTVYPELVEFQFSLFISASSEGFGGSFQFITPPFLPEWIKVDTEYSDENKKVDWNINLGDDAKYGRIIIESPLFSITDNGFEAGASIKIDKELKIPLIPFKQFVGFVIKDQEAINKMFPDALPIGLPSLMDDKGHFRVKEIIELFNKYNIGLPEDVKKSLQEALEKINEYLKGMEHRIPERLKKYLEPQFEEGFKGFDVSFYFKIGSDGSIDIKLENNNKEHPIHILWPQLGLPPALMGCMFNSFSIGTLLGGSLFKIEVNCEFDSFDLLNLAIGLLFPEKSIIPIAYNFHNHLIIKEFMMLIIYETEIPIPIPVFYDELGYEYLNVAGFSMEAHAGFPNPLKNINIVNFLKLLLKFIDFIKDPKKQFITTEEEKKMFPNFWLSKCYLELPEYIKKDAYVGTKNKFVFESLDIVANVLNGIKFFSPEKIIDSIPKENRSGDLFVTLEFAGILLGKSYLKWLLSTPKDFTTNLYTDIVDNFDDAKELLSVLPYNLSPETSGAICFIKASININFLASCYMTFGFVSAGKNCIATGFLIKGNFLEIYKLFLSADIIINGDKKQIDAVGKFNISFWEISILQGNTNAHYSSDGFEIQGELKALTITNFPPLLFGHVGGKINKDVFNFSGLIQINFLYIPLMSGNINITNTEWKLTTNLLGLEMIWLIEIKNDSVLFSYGDSISILSASIEFKKSLALTALLTANLGLMKLNADFATPAIKGNYNLSFFNLPLATGSISLSGNEYSLYGAMDLFICKINLGGYFRPISDIGLTGGGTIGIENIFSASLNFTIGTNKVGVEGKITVIFIFSTSGCVTWSRDLNCLAIYLFYSVPIFFWQATFYLRIGFNGNIYIPSTTKPNDWPSSCIVKNENTEPIQLDMLVNILNQNDHKKILIRLLKHIFKDLKKGKFGFKTEADLNDWFILSVIYNIEISLLPNKHIKSDILKNFNKLVIIKRPEQKLEKELEINFFNEFDKKIKLMINTDKKLKHDQKIKLTDFFINNKIDIIKFGKPINSVKVEAIWSSSKTGFEIKSNYDCDSFNNTCKLFLKIFFHSNP